MVAENFDFLVRQILLGVPMLLTWDGKHCSILDLSDYDCWLLGAISSSEADQVVVLLNELYTEMRRISRESSRARRHGPDDKDHAGG